MPAERLEMRPVREIPRYRSEQGLGGPEPLCRSVPAHVRFRDTVFDVFEDRQRLSDDCAIGIPKDRQRPHGVRVLTSGGGTPTNLSGASYIVTATSFGRFSAR